MRKEDIVWEEKFPGNNMKKQGLPRKSVVNQIKLTRKNVEITMKVTRKNVKNQLVYPRKNVIYLIISNVRRWINEKICNGKTVKVEGKQA